MKRLGSMVLITVLFMTGSIGCSRADETLSTWRQSLKQDIALHTSDTEHETNAAENKLEVPDPNDITIEETYDPVQTIGNAIEERTVSLYFANQDKTKLVRIEKKIPKVEGMARATLETLLEGPDQTSGLRAAIPSGTQLLDINVKPEEKRCIVDFSQELRQQLSGGNVGESLAVYSIANTLCQFDTIKEVEFRIEGQTVTTLAGGVDLSRAITTNAAIVIPEK